MLVKIILKIWPALIPILGYIIWNFLIKKLIAKYSANKVVDVEKVVGKKSTETYKTKAFSLQNKNFVIILYLSLILAILSVISFAFD